MTDDVQSLVSAVRETLNTGPQMSDSLPLLIAPAVLIAIALVVVRLTRKKPEPPPQIAPDFFAVACSLLRLSPQERRDLKAVVEGGMISHPARVLLSPGNLAQALRASNMSKDDALRGRIELLSQKVFGAPLPVVK